MNRSRVFSRAPGALALRRPGAAAYCLVALAAAGLCAKFAPEAAAQIVLSGNETKIDLTSGSPRVVPAAGPDSVSILDFSRFPPSVQHLTGVPNSVLGPPSNIAIAPNGRLALVANSIAVDPADPSRWVPESYAHVLELRGASARVVGRVETGAQPSGISFTPDGRLALVANRAAGTVSVLAVEGSRVTHRGAVKVCEPAESVSDVAIAPNGALALASVQKGGYLAVLKIADGQVQTTGRKISTAGQPYRCVITPDGELGLTAGQGFGNGLDHDAVTVIDLNARPVTTVDYVAVGAVPESIELSPNGRLLAVVLMNGSNLAPTDPNYSPHARLVLMRRDGKTFRVAQTLPIGRIPEGVAFTSDGRYLVVQCHPDRELWILAVRGAKLRDTGHRVSVPGWPSSLRAAR